MSRSGPGEYGTTGEKRGERQCASANVWAVPPAPPGARPYVQGEGRGQSSPRCALDPGAEPSGFKGTPAPPVLGDSRCVIPLSRACPESLYLKLLTPSCLFPQTETLPVPDSTPSPAVCSFIVKIQKMLNAHFLNYIMSLALYNSIKFILSPSPTDWL